MSVHEHPPSSFLDVANLTFNPVQMHLVLQIPELAGIIVNHLIQEPRCGPSIISLALTCRRLSNVALDALWGCKELEPPEILQPLVASGVFGHLGRRNKFSFLTIIRAPCKDDWDRYLPYARRVKSVWWRAARVKGDVLPLLIHSSPYGAPFPHLQDLTFDIVLSRDAFFEYDQFFVSSMRSFKVKEHLLRITADLPSRPDPALDSCLRSLPLRCPNLTTIDIGLAAYYSHPGGAEDARRKSLSLEKLFIGIFQGLKMLEVVVLAITSLSMDLLHHLATLPDLKELALCQASSLEGDNPEFAVVSEHENIPSPTFPSLQKLKFEQGGPIQATISQFAQLTNDSPLRHITLIWKCDGAVSIQNILEAYGPACGQLARDLREIELRSWSSPSSGSFYEGISKWKISIHHLFALSARPFHNLTKFCLNCPLHFELDDNELIKLANWLPQLEELTLGHVDDRRLGDWSRPKATLKGLIGISKVCRRLKTVGLSVDLAPVESLGELCIENHPSWLQSWNTLHSRVCQPQEVGKQLASLFPRLDQLKGPWEPVDDDEEPEEHPSAEDQHFMGISDFLRRVFSARHPVEGFEVEEADIESYWVDYSPPF